MNVKWDWPETDDMRVRVRFLLLPKRLRTEWRWLELVAIVQLYRKCLFGGRGRWIDMAFANESKQTSIVRNAWPL